VENLKHAARVKKKKLNGNRKAAPKAAKEGKEDR
jgi:hypothetical protein